MRRGSRIPWLGLVVVSALVAAPAVWADESAPQPSIEASEPVASAPTEVGTSTASPAAVTAPAPESIVIWLLDPPATAVRSTRAHIVETVRPAATPPTAASTRAAHRKAVPTVHSTTSAVKRVTVESRQHPQSGSRPQPTGVVPGVAPLRRASLPAAGVSKRAPVESSAPVGETPLTSVGLLPVSVDANLNSADDNLIYRWDWKALVVALSGLCLLAVAGMRRIGAGSRRTKDPEPAAGEPEVPVTARLSPREQPAASPDEVFEDVRVRHSA